MASAAPFIANSMAIEDDLDVINQNLPEPTPTTTKERFALPREFVFASKVYEKEHQTRRKSPLASILPIDTLLTGKTMSVEGRNHLANERTFLSFVRCVITMISAGFTIAHLPNTLPHKYEASRLLLVFGIILHLYSCFRYFLVVVRDRGEYDVGKFSTSAITCLCLVGIVISISILQVSF